MTRHFDRANERAAVLIKLAAHSPGHDLVAALAAARRAIGASPDGGPSMVAAFEAARPVSHIRA